MFKHDIEQHPVVSFTLSGNMSKRFLRTVKTHLRCYYYGKQRQWNSKLHIVQNCLNTYVNQTLGKTAHMLMFKHPPNHALSTM